MGIMIEIQIIPPPPGPNILNSKHWSYRHKLKKRILNEVWGQMVGKYVKTPILVHACRYSVQTMDTDNLIASLKVILDAIAAQILPPPLASSTVSKGINSLVNSPFDILFVRSSAFGCRSKFFIMEETKIGSLYACRINFFVLLES